MALLSPIARLLFGRLLPRWPYPVLGGPLRGSWFILGAAAGEAGGVSVHLGRVEPQQSRCVQELLRPGQVFFDVGANVGYYTLLASRCVGPRGTVLSFEPVPRNVAYLYRHVRLNRARNVIILPLACADLFAVEPFAPGEDHSVGHLVGPPSGQAEGGGPGERALVATVGLDAIAERLGLWPNMVKIDVEGAELRVLKGARELLARAKSRILLSVHSAWLRAECLAYLRQSGYQVKPLDRPSTQDATEFLAEPPA